MKGEVRISTAQIRVLEGDEREEENVKVKEIIFDDFSGFQTWFKNSNKSQARIILKNFTPKMYLEETYMTNYRKTH